MPAMPVMPTFRKKKTTKFKNENYKTLEKKR